MKKFALFLLLLICTFGVGVGGVFVGLRLAEAQATDSSIIVDEIAAIQDAVVAQETMVQGIVQDFLTFLEAEPEVEEDDYIFETINVLHEEIYRMRHDMITREEMFSALETRALTMTELFVLANPASVAISVETRGTNMFGQQTTRASAGSGFIISPDGYVLTNDHVLGNASQVTVLMYDGRSYRAEIIARKPEGDLALLKINSPNEFYYLPFGDSDELMVGEQVAAIGNPLGEFANSMTVGHVSALDRELTIDGVRLTLLQTDTAVNRGNSGGPLINDRGQVIGVITAKSTGDGVEGLGFAIPSNVAYEVVYAWLNPVPETPTPVIGVNVDTMTDSFGRRWVLIVDVHNGSGARAAGIESGDIIITASGVIISSITELREVLSHYAPGDTLSLVVSRDGEQMSINVVLG